MGEAEGVHGPGFGAARVARGGVVEQLEPHAVALEVDGVELHVRELQQGRARLPGDPQGPHLPEAEALAPEAPGPAEIRDAEAEVRQPLNAHGAGIAQPGGAG